MFKIPLFGLSSVFYTSCTKKEPYLFIGKTHKFKNCLNLMTLYFKKWCFSKPTQFTRAYEKNTKGEMIANETHNEEAVLLLAFVGNGRGRKSD